jgi:hypothetical protein
VNQRRLCYKGTYEGNEDEENHRKILSALAFSKFCVEKVGKRYGHNQMA